MPSLYFIVLLCLSCPTSSLAGASWSGGLINDGEETSLQTATANHYREIDTNTFVKQILTLIPDGYDREFLYLCTRLKSSVSSKQQMQELMILLTRLKPEDYTDRQDSLQSILDSRHDWEHKLISLERHISLWNKTI